ncbi:transglutaminase-like cysteine peptidase [Sphingomonas cavernae]|nr:transglutaminase-like cysteine peptidase [Sphingomonas cavernae]
MTEMVAQQQSATLSATPPCSTTGEREAAIRHHDDAAAFDPSGGPAIFGSVAVPVQRTPFDARLRKVRPASLTSMGPWSTAVAQARRLDRLDQLRHINRWVNDRLGYTSDQVLNGMPDLWSSAASTLARGRGDCEDYAIAKMALLASLGFRAEDLFLVLVRDGARRDDHAILAVRAEGRLHVLDSTTNEVRESSLVPDYFPVMSFAAGRAWLHGYRVNSPAEPLRIATTTQHHDWSERGR